MTTNDEILHRMAESSMGEFINDDAFAAEGAGIVVDLSKAMSGRMFFISAGLMGMAPAEAQAGDAICILLGCSCPVILRPYSDGEFYTLIGEAYVDGYMTGKGMDELEDGRYVLKDFEIR
jgi:hypothetical protein